VAAPSDKFSAALGLNAGGNELGQLCQRQSGSGQTFILYAA